MKYYFNDSWKKYRNYLDDRIKRIMWIERNHSGIIVAGIIIPISRSRVRERNWVNAKGTTLNPVWISQPWEKRVFYLKKCYSKKQISYQVSRLTMSVMMMMI